MLKYSLVIILLLCPSAVFGSTLAFGPSNAKIEGSIPYTLIGHYRAGFKVFSGRIGLDGRSIEFVDLDIDAKSLHSNWTGCDKLARSRRLLNVVKYPRIVFKSQGIVKEAHAYTVTGILSMHGVSRRMSFPFQFEERRLTGTWVINRKLFNIIWSKYLDHGGVLVGDDLTVTWEIDR